MKKKITVGVLLIPVVALAGLTVASLLQIRHTKQELEATVTRMKASKPVLVDFVVSPPSDTPKDQPLYLSGSVPALGNWDAAGLPLEKKEDGKWHASAEVLSGIDYGFKITRGTWGTVESDEKGLAVGDRSLKVSSAQPVEVSVAEWVDHGQSVPGRMTTTGDVRLLKKFKSKILNNDRTIAMWLPPGYDDKANAGRRYPVLYMQDGQNLFDESTSFAGIEWKMDEAAQKLVSDGQANAFIIVGIYNSPDRNSEYTPGQRLNLYGRFVTEELKPWIDQTYRTQTDAAHTAIGGGSLGAESAMYIAKQQSGVFGQMLLLSPWLRAGDSSIVADWVGDGKWLAGKKVYLSMGAAPVKGNYPGDGPAAVADAKAVVEAMKTAGLKAESDFSYAENSAGSHEEKSWQAETEPALKWLYAR